jgi:hypothetical protein
MTLLRIAMATIYITSTVIYTVMMLAYVVVCYHKRKRDGAPVGVRWKSEWLFGGALIVAIWPLQAAVLLSLGGVGAPKLVKYLYGRKAKWCHALANRIKAESDWHET